MNNDNNYNDNDKQKKSTNPLSAILKILGVIGAAAAGGVVAGETAHRVSESRTREKAQQDALNKNNYTGDN